MKTSHCPNCSESPRFSFWERQMMSTHGGKSCNNCKTILVTSKWENWLIAPMMFVAVIGGQHLDETFNLWIMLFGVIVFCLIYTRLMHLLLPFKVQKKSDI